MYLHYLNFSRLVVHQKISSLVKFGTRSYKDIAIKDIPNVTPSIIKKALKTNNISFEEGYTSFIVPCSVCAKSSKSTSKLYINKMTGSFVCTCSNSGNWHILEQQILSKRMQKNKNVKEFFENLAEIEKNNKFIDSIKTTTKPLKSLSEESVNGVLQQFNLPTLPKTAFSNLDVRIDDDNKNLYFPLENVESRVVGYRILNSKEKTEVVRPASQCEGILIGKLSRQKDQAIIVPNISDFLILLNSKLSGYAVCLPNGIIQLPLYVLPSLERFNKLILWFGNDYMSWDSARSFSKKLGEKRCFFIRPNEKQPLPHLSENLDFKSIITSAQPLWHKSITTFTSLREDVFSDLQNIDKVEGVKWKRFPTLNKILKGHRRGELTVLTGPTGSGKTTFISEYSLDLAIQGVNTLWGSFEIRNTRLARTMLQQFSGISLENNLEQFDAFADAFEKLPIYYMTFHGQQMVKTVMEAVEHAHYVHDIAHVIIDNVQFMMGMTEDHRHIDRFWKQDLIIAAFRTFATRKNCHVTLVIHPRKEKDSEDLTTSSIFGGAKASQEADNVLIIQDKRLTSIRGKKYLQIAKNRYSGDLGIMALDFDKSRLSYAQKKKKSVQEKENVETQSAASESQ